MCTDRPGACAPAAGALCPATAARAACRLSGWTLSNLALQRTLYLAQMLHLGRHGVALINAPFEAWERAPVVVAVYRQASAFGAAALCHVFPGAAEVTDPLAHETLRVTVAALKARSAVDLVAIAQPPGGAWARRRGCRGSPLIPRSEILAEYHRRTGA
ncbi:putative phage-associated protein [Natronocella acetinitrilica]|uniref:Phage-associated protein n=1 Tax=Natronocella acetinitrilica TaxID=414046 RepID=A0AAE3KAF7_9GAMM|nr:putative phage-associated protein [Natronocella acetinitrilica]